MRKGMGVRRKGNSPHKNDPDENPGELGSAFGRFRTACSHAQENAAGRKVSGKNAAPLQLSFRIAARRFRVEPKRKREEYVFRLERIIRTCENALNNPGAMEKIQLKAAEVIIKAIKISYEIVREADIEDLERLAAEIKAKLEERGQQSSSGT